MVGINKMRELTPMQKGRRLERAYATHFAPLEKRPLQSVPAEDLQAMFEAADMLAFYAAFDRSERGVRYLERMIAADGALRAKGIRRADNARSLYGGLIAARRFDEAKAFAAATPELDAPALPAFDTVADFDPARPAYYELVGPGRMRLRNAEPLGRGPRIVVVSGCHFARDAALAIGADARLKHAFSQGQALWLGAPERSLDTKDIAEWNAELPHARMVVAYRPEPWRDIDFSSMPRFHVFKDGKLLGSHSGWGRSSPAPELLDLLRRAGLLE
ncbi:hypothetical protein A7A76_18900 [Lysobacter enzymogenes]|uniref:hypothetical protein n=1 Tax=Lysobacter enzymogenes TaxID=69 RepID=UPI0019D1DAD5|nr:hypothetical protein [Lysobacter enzymogenes]MBN7136816.1 hypothetical protein [Lysobacter enzymogenes]